MEALFLKQKRTMFSKKVLFRGLLGTLLVLALVYSLGPSPCTPVYQTTLPELPTNPQSLEAYIAQKEQRHNLKPDNHAQIIWNDSLHTKTEYAIVYLHGFRASREEGNPVHQNMAKQFGCNLYLSRLSQHGIDTTEQLVNLSPDNLWESAKEALAIGQQLGNKVILMGTSTGASLALQLAAAYPEVYALVLLSPNIAINDPNAWLLNNPWGLQIARIVKQSNYNFAGNGTDTYERYWNGKYRLEALVQLQEYIETAMLPSTFAQIHQPVLCLYYYKDEEHQDPVVKVSAMLEMMDQLGTDEIQKQAIALPNAENHVLGSHVVSKDIPQVEAHISHFLNRYLNP